MELKELEAEIAKWEAYAKQLSCSDYPKKRLKQLKRQKKKLQMGR